MPHEGYADRITNDGPRFHSNMPVSELTEPIARAIEASNVSLAPPIAETVDGVMHETWSTPIEPNGARGLEPPDPDLGIRPTGVQRPPRKGLEAASHRTELGENVDEPQWPLPDPLRSR